MSDDPTEALQIAGAAALLAEADVTTIVKGTPSGPAVFAPGQPFDDVFPRATLEIPQVLDHSNSCAIGSQCFLTVHSWAQGPDATLVAGRLAGAVRKALNKVLTIEGHVCVTGVFESSRPAGDPDPTVQHLVSVFRYLTRPAQA